MLFSGTLLVHDKSLGEKLCESYSVFSIQERVIPQIYPAEHEIWLYSWSVQKGGENKNVYDIEISKVIIVFRFLSYFRISVEIKNMI